MWGLGPHLTIAPPGSGNRLPRAAAFPGNTAREHIPGARKEAPSPPREAVGFPSLGALKPTCVTCPRGPDRLIPTAPSQPHRFRACPGGRRARPGVPGGGGAARPALTRAGRRAGGRSPAPEAGGAAPSSSPPSGWRGRGEAAHPPPDRAAAAAPGRAAGGAEGDRPLCARPLPARARPLLPAGPGPAPRPFHRLTR